MSDGADAAGPRVEVAIAVVEDQGRFLIGQRQAGGTLPGYWEFPGGKIEAGETREDAAVRECREETGLSIRVTGAFPTIDYDYAHARLRLHFIACALSEANAPLPARFRWVERAALRDYEFPPANASVLALLERGVSESGVGRRA
jgi:mutator protein MutT